MRGSIINGSALAVIYGFGRSSKLRFVNAAMATRSVVLKRLKI